MEATQAQANELERRLDLSIPIADVEKEMDQRLKRISKNVKMPGFRPGKVPLNIVRQQYGDQARHEILTEALDKAFGAAVDGQKLRVAGYPRIEPKTSESTTHLEFSAIFEIYPEFALGDLTNTDVERPILEVGNAEVDQTVDILRQQRVRYEAADRGAEDQAQGLRRRHGVPPVQGFQGWRIGCAPSQVPPQRWSGQFSQASPAPQAMGRLPPPHAAARPQGATVARWAHGRRGHRSLNHTLMWW